MHGHISSAAAPVASTFCVRASSPLTLLALTASLPPTLHQPCKLILCDARWRCAMPNELLVTSLALGSWKLLEELQRHLHVPGLQSASRVPTHFTGLPPRLPACSLSVAPPPPLHLRQSFLKLLNTANYVRRGARFIWIFWLQGDLHCVGEELRKDVWEWGAQLEMGFSVEQNVTSGRRHGKITDFLEQKLFCAKPHQLVLNLSSCLTLAWFII